MLGRAGVNAARIRALSGKTERRGRINRPAKGPLHEPHNRENAVSTSYIMGCPPFFNTTGWGCSPPLWNLPLDFPHKMGYTTNYIGISLPYFLYYAVYAPQRERICRKTGGSDYKIRAPVNGGASGENRGIPSGNCGGLRGAMRFRFRNRRCVVPGIPWKTV